LQVLFSGDHLAAHAVAEWNTATSPDGGKLGITRCRPLMTAQSMFEALCMHLSFYVCISNTADLHLKRYPKAEPKELHEDWVFPLVFV
jgi:hypothetical protein